jgi:hypothetical protein
MEPVLWGVGDASEQVCEPVLGTDAIELTGLCRPPNYAESGRFPQISG